MLGTLVVGLGRSGTGLHLPVLRRLRRDCAGTFFGPPPFGPGPMVVFDPHRAAEPAGDLVAARSLDHAAALTDPARTVAHLCTPPTARLRPLTELAERGFRRVLVEKPLAADEPAVRDVLRLRDAAGLDLVPVNQWRHSELTRRIVAVLRDGRLGGLRSISFVQRKPRFGRTVDGDDHPSAFDVEAPHSIALAVLLAGPARVVDAGCTDLVVGDVTYPWLGAAWLRLRHDGGVRTEIRTDLTSPVRERRITVELDGGTLVGHFPVSADDHYGQLRLAGASSGPEVFRDDSLSAFLVGAYRHFAGHEPIPDEPATGAAVTRLIGDAKRLAGLLPHGGQP